MSCLVISLDNSQISLSVTAGNLEVTVDNQPSFSSRIAKLTRSCWDGLQNMRRIWSISISGGHSGAWSVTGLLQLSSNMSAREFKMQLHDLSASSLSYPIPPTYHSSHLTLHQLGLDPASLRMQEKLASILVCVLAPIWWNEIPLAVFLPLHEELKFALCY